jgi:hypothetical protein
MPDEPKATPRPWKLKGLCIFSEDGRYICDYGAAISVDEDKHNLELIVRSVNDRAALIAKVERYERALKIIADTCGDPYCRNLAASTLGEGK